MLTALLLTSALGAEVGGGDIAGSVTAAENAQFCRDFSLDVSKELRLFESSDPVQIIASASQGSATLVNVDQLYAVTLARQGKVMFATPPRQLSEPHRSFAGLLAISSPHGRTIRVASSQAAWIEVISANKRVQSARHTGNARCKLLRKVVEFSVPQDDPMIIQISGSSEEQINLAVTTNSAAWP